MTEIGNENLETALSNASSFLQDAWVVADQERAIRAMIDEAQNTVETCLELLAERKETR